MNISFNWIDELAGLRGALRDPRVLAERLTMTAATVEKIETVGAGLDGIVVSRVLETRPHPNADRLTLCRVDRGAGEALDVVCGAPVIARGGFYPHVAPGGKLPAGFRIESRKIRGELSHGMLCSEAELELGRDKGGIMRLADGLEPGTPLAAALGLPDTRLTLDLNPNRVDLACHVGVAREVGGPPAPRDFGGPGWSPEWRDGESEASGAGVTVRIRSLSGDRLVVTMPVGVSFAAEGGRRDMVSRRDAAIRLFDDEWRDWAVRSVGRQPDRRPAGPGDGLRIEAPEALGVLEALMYAMQVGTYRVSNSPLLYIPRTHGIEQAAVWIAGADPRYDDIAPALQDDRMPTQYAVAFALVYCDLAGIDVRSRRIWADRERVFGPLRDQGLNVWYQIKTR